MLISRRYGFLYVHIPKTGGSSVTAALAPYLDVQREVSEKDRHGWQVPHHKHGMHGLLGGVVGRYRDLEVCCSVRNPWDRAVSMYRYWSGPSRAAEGRSFAQFLGMLRNPDSGFAKWTYYQQTDWIRGSGHPLVMRFETLDADWKTMCVELGLPELTLPHRNRRPGPAADWRSWYDTETRDAVATLFAEDVDRFGYQFA